MAYRHAILLGNVNSLQLSIRYSVVSSHPQEQNTQVADLQTLIDTLGDALKLVSP